MIEFDDAVDDKVETARRVGWRYGPFLTGRFGSPGPLDQKALYGNETEGATFFSSVSLGLCR